MKSTWTRRTVAPRYANTTSGISVPSPSSSPTSSSTALVFKQLDFGTSVAKVEQVAPTPSEAGPSAATPITTTPTAATAADSAISLSAIEPTVVRAPLKGPPSAPVATVRPTATSTFTVNPLSMSTSTTTSTSTSSIPLLSTSTSTSTSTPIPEQQPRPVQQGTPSPKRPPMQTSESGPSQPSSTEKPQRPQKPVSKVSAGDERATLQAIPVSSIPRSSDRVPTPTTRAEPEVSRETDSGQPVVVKVPSSRAAVSSPGSELTRPLETLPTRGTDVSDFTSASATLATPTNSALPTSGPSATVADDRVSSDDSKAGGFLGSPSAGPGVNSTVTLQENANGSSGSSMGIIVGSTVGSIAAISLIALFLWLWRRKSQRQSQGCLPSPLATSPSAPMSEKAFGFGRRGGDGSGRKALPLRLAAAAGFRRASKPQQTSPTSRHMLDAGTGRAASHFLRPEYGRTSMSPLTTNAAPTKNRFLDWWGSRSDGDNFNWQMYNQRAHEADLFLMRGPEGASRINNGHDVPLSVGGKGAKGNRPISHDRDGPEHFRVALDAVLDGEGSFNPFSDTNALPGSTIDPKPPTTSNPFAEANAMYQPRPVQEPIPTYPNHPRRGRSQSQSLGGIQASATHSRTQSLYRDSHVSNDPCEDRRTKFRSDQFDLELCQGMAPDAGSAARKPVNTATSSMYSELHKPSSMHLNSGHTHPSYVQVPLQSLTRTPRGSFSSKYTSGVSSLSDWDDAPVPEVGHLIGRWDSPTLAEAFQRRPSARRVSEESVVGQAL